MNMAMINNKGGTGKTTTCVNVSAFLAMSGHRVLLVDLDAQASASLSLGVPYEELTPSVSDILFDGFPVKEAVRATTTINMDLLTGGMALASTDLMLADVPGRENKLAEAMAQISHHYDYILFDCPPSLSMLSINALVAADAYIIPVTAEYLALEGLISMIQAVEEVKKGMGIDPPLLGIVFAMVIPGLKSARQIIRLVREQYADQVFTTEVHRNVNLSEAPSFGMTIFQYAPRSTGAGRYTDLAGEIQKRCGVRKKQRG